MNKNYEALENRFNRMDALGGAISMLHWDMSAMMPKGGTASRTDQLAVLKTLHQMIKLKHYQLWAQYMKN